MKVTTRLIYRCNLYDQHGVWEKLERRMLSESRL